MELTLIKFNDDRLLTLPVIKDKIKILKEFVKNEKNDKSKKYKSSILYLTSGINYIPTEYWSECKTHKSIISIIESGRIEEVSSEKTKGEDGKVKLKNKSFKELNIKEKEKVLSETFDIRSLNLYLDEETSPDFRLSIQKRIDGINDGSIEDETVGNSKFHKKV